MPSTTRRGVLATLGVASLAGCFSIDIGGSGDLGSVEGAWPMFGHDAAHRRFVPASPREPSAVWDTAFPEVRSVGAPSVADGRVYATADAVSDRARHRYRLYALGAATGKHRWQVPLRAEPVDPPAVVGSRIVVSALRDLHRGRVVAFEERYGQEAWLYDIDARVTAPPVADGTRVYVPDWSGDVHALSSVDGAVEWAGAVDPDGADRTFAQPIAIANGTGFLGSLSGRTGVVAIEAQTGAPRWTRSTGAVTGGPVADDELVVVESHSLLYAFDHAGTQRWTYNIPEEDPSSSLALDDQHLYVTREHTLHAIGRDGEPGWTFEGLASGGPPPTIAGNTVLVDGGGELLGLDRAEGEVRWRVDAAGSGDVVALGDAIFMRAADGNRILGLGEA